MKTYLEITQEEFDWLKAMKPKYEYTDGEITQLYNFIKQFINPHIATCLSCSGNLRDAKNQAMSWLNFYEQQIIDNLSPKIEEPVVVTKKTNARTK